MRTYIAPVPISTITCKYCKERLGYWIPGIPIKEHSHPGCAGKAAAQRSMAELRQLLKED